MTDTRFDYDGEGSMSYGMWRANVQRAINGRRGQQALADLEAALLALPEKRLIAGALCTEFGEVCTVGALIVHKRVAAGEDRDDVIADLANSYFNMASETAEAGRDHAGLTFTLAWELAELNDEDLAGMTDVRRYDAVLAWVRAHRRAAGAPS